MLSTTVKPKTCAYEKCGRTFLPLMPMQRVCRPLCAQRFARQVRDEKEAKEKQDTKARKQAMESIRYLIKAAQKEFNAFVRARDEGKPCICCGRTANDKDLLTGSRWDAGHYRSTGSASHLRFHEDNCHRQLVYCNRDGAGRAVDYRIGLIARIGLHRVEALEASNQPHKWTHAELRGIRDTYRAKLKAMKKETP